MSGLHHVEIWVADLEAAVTTWGWLLPELGWSRTQEWPGGQTWSTGPDSASLTLTLSPNLSDPVHDRRRPGLNHLAFRAGGRARVDEISDEAPHRGWTPLYADRYPHAGGPDHYAAWFENPAGFKVEIVADGDGDGDGEKRGSDGTADLLS